MAAVKVTAKTRKLRVDVSIVLSIPPSSHDETKSFQVADQFVASHASFSDAKVANDFIKFNSGHMAPWGVPRS